MSDVKLTKFLKTPSNVGLRSTFVANLFFQNWLLHPEMTASYFPQLSTEVLVFMLIFEIVF